MTALLQVKEQDVDIPVGWSSISALVAVRQSPVVVIALHPWGPMGGSMYDPHPHTVCALMGKSGCSTVRFNFRSGLGFGGGSIEDVKAVARSYSIATMGFYCTD